MSTEIIELTPSTVAHSMLTTACELALRSLVAIAAQGGDIGNGLTLWASSSPWAEAAFRNVAKDRGVRLHKHINSDDIDLVMSESCVTVATLYLKDNR